MCSDNNNKTFLADNFYSCSKSRSHCEPGVTELQLTKHSETNHDVKNLTFVPDEKTLPK